jgi:hypothetical protein
MVAHLCLQCRAELAFLRPKTEGNSLKYNLNDLPFFFRLKDFSDRYAITR